VIDAESLAPLALFAELEPPQLEALAQTLDEERHARDTRVLRQGMSGNAFYVILSGEASVRIDGTERARLAPGEFFGEVSILLGEPPTADVVAATEELRCAVLAGPDFRPLLLQHPTVLYRVLQNEARRLRNANLWKGE
jgi:CRP-like cAMP-binding protein